MVDSQEAGVETGYVETERDTLYYEVRGSGQPLLMISGGGGDAGYYANIAPLLADEYQIICYDRRGHSRSSRRDPQNFEMSQQARDAAAVLRAVGHHSAYIFGNSGGASIALEMARSLPENIIGMVAHEPPVLRMLPNADEWLARHTEFYLTARRGDTNKAWRDFGGTVLLSPGFAYAPELQARVDRNANFFMLNEFIPFGMYTADVEAIRANGTRVVMGTGKITHDAKVYYGMTAPIVADRLGCELVVFPGHHVSYLDMAEEWSTVLRGILRRM